MTLLDVTDQLLADVGPPNVGVRFYLREGQRTVDSRTVDVGAVTFNRTPPYPIMLQTVRADGHDGSQLCGIIKVAARVSEDVIIAEGFLANSGAGMEAMSLLNQGVLQTWSPDFGDAAIPDVTDDGLEHLASATFLGATIVAFPAIDSAVIELFDLVTREVIVPAPHREGQPIAGSSNMFISSTSANWPTTATFTNIAITAELVASAAPSSHFSNPKLPSLQRYVTITEDGRVYGHLADLGNECHIGFSDTCISAPQESDYSAFTVGTVLTSDGVTIPTGPIALKGGHAEMGLDAKSARAHYDDPSTAVADVAIGVDDHAIWFSGSLRPGVTEDQVHALRASGVSGDWRKIGDSLRLIGICSVNVPGFPKLAIAASASGDIEALVAAGGSPIPHPNDCNCSDTYTELVNELDDLQKLVADAGLEDTAINRLASRIPADDIDTLYSRIA